jgi:hypothetical protein
MKSKDSNAEEYGDIFTMDNQSVSIAPEIKEPTQRSNKKDKKIKKEKFNAPINKKPSNFNINLSFNDNIDNKNIIDSNITNLTLDLTNNVNQPSQSNIAAPIQVAVQDNPTLTEYKQRKAEYKQIKQELEANPTDEEKMKYKKKLKKRIKQLMAELQM